MDLPHVRKFLSYEKLNLELEIKSQTVDRKLYINLLHYGLMGLIHTEYGGSVFLQNVGSCLSDHISHSAAEI